MAAVYPDLDLSQVVIDDTVLLAIGGADTVMDKADGSIHMIEKEVKEPNVEAVDHHASKGQTIPNSLTTPEVICP